MAKQQTIFGYVNCAAFNSDPNGDRHWYETRAARDAALSEFRAYAIEKGLSENASLAGIYPVKRVLRGHDLDRVDEILTAAAG